MTFTLFVITAFIIWLASIWTAILSLISIIGGWKALSVLYPPDPSQKNDHGVKYSMCSIKLGLITYRYCINIFFTDTGINLDVIKIFRVMHKPVFIPYDRISGAEKGKSLNTYTKFKADGKTIMIYGNAGEELFSRLNPQDKTV